jgi:hypothetical protein
MRKQFAYVDQMVNKYFQEFSTKQEATKVFTRMVANNPAALPSESLSVKCWVGPVE